MKKVVLFSFLLSCVGVGLLVWPHKPAVPELDDEDLSALPAPAQGAASSPAAGTVVNQNSAPADAGHQTLNSSSGDSSATDSLAAKVRELADKSPREAADFAASIQEPVARQSALEQTAISWAERDLSGATNWLASLPAGEAREVVSRDIAYEAARTNAVVALELAADMSASRERNDLIVHAIRQWANDDPASATTWAQQIDDEKLKEQVLGAISAVAAQSHGPEAADLVASSMTGGAEQEKAAVRVAKAWGRTNPAAAAQWVEQFPESLARAAAVQLVMSVWRAQDPASADNWLAKMTGKTPSTLQ